MLADYIYIIYSLFNNVELLFPSETLQPAVTLKQTHLATSSRLLWRYEGLHNYLVLLLRDFFMSLVYCLDTKTYENMETLCVLVFGFSVDPLSL
jgi:hypothetical protein